jgi:regulator of replication initiation timing
MNENTIKSLQSEIERLKLFNSAQVLAREELKVEKKELQKKIKEQELIIHGIEEGSNQWESLCSDKDRLLTKSQEIYNQTIAKMDQIINERDGLFNQVGILQKEIGELKINLNNLLESKKEAILEWQKASDVMNARLAALSLSKSELIKLIKELEEKKP